MCTDTHMEIYTETLFAESWFKFHWDRVRIHRGTENYGWSWIKLKYMNSNISSYIFLSICSHRRSRYETSWLKFLKSLGFERLPDNTDKLRRLGKIFINPTSDSGLLSKMHKELKKLATLPNNPLKNKRGRYRTKPWFHNRRIVNVWEAPKDMFKFLNDQRKCKSKWPWDSTLHQDEWLRPKPQVTTHVGKDTEKEEHSSIADWIANW